MLHYKKHVLIYLHAKAVKSDIEAYNRKCFTVRSLLNLCSTIYIYIYIYDPGTW